VGEVRVLEGGANQGFTAEIKKTNRGKKKKGEKKKRKPGGGEKEDGFHPFLT